MPLPFDISPDGLFRKALQAFTVSEAETSESAAFPELKSRRYRAAVREVYEVALQLPARWFGWRIISREKNLGGMAAFKCDIFSALLGGNRLELSIWFQEEISPDGALSTLVNAKCISQAPTKGDLGEARRNIGFFLFALDEEFRIANEPPHPSPSDSSSPTTQKATTTSVSAPSEPTIQRPKVTIKRDGVQRISIKHSAPEP